MKDNNFLFIYLFLVACAGPVMIFFFFLKKQHKGHFIFTVFSVYFFV